MMANRIRPIVIPILLGCSFRWDNRVMTIEPRKMRKHS